MLTIEKKILALKGVHDSGKTSCLKELIKNISNSGARLIECGALYPYSTAADMQVNDVNSLDSIANVDGDVFGVFYWNGSVVAIITQGDEEELLKNAFNTVNGIIYRYMESIDVEKELFVCAIRSRGRTKCFLEELDGFSSITIIDKMSLVNLNYEESKETNHVQSWLNKRQADIMLNLIEYFCTENVDYLE